MAITHWFLRSRPLGLLMLGGLYAAGCGGSAYTAGGGAAGAGAAAAGGASGGSASGGEGGKCIAACLAIACGEGSRPVIMPGSCCPTCVPDGQGGASAGGASAGGASAGGASAGGASAGGASAGAGGSCAGVSCPGYNCVKGSRLEKKPGECCATCVPDPQVCTDGQAGYRKLREMLLQQSGVLSCVTKTDCALLSSNAFCGDQCSAIPVSSAAAPEINQQLSSWASNNCSTCMPIYPPCSLPPPVVCVNKQCVLGTVLGGPP